MVQLDNVPSIETHDRVLCFYLGRLTLTVKQGVLSEGRDSVLSHCGHRFNRTRGGAMFHSYSTTEEKTVSGRKRAPQKHYTGSSAEMSKDENSAVIKFRAGSFEFSEEELFPVASKLLNKSCQLTRMTNPEFY